MVVRARFLPRSFQAGSKQNIRPEEHDVAPLALTLEGHYSSHTQLERSQPNGSARLTFPPVEQQKIVLLEVSDGQYGNASDYNWLSPNCDTNHTCFALH